MQPSSISDDDDNLIGKKGIRSGMPWAISRPEDGDLMIALWAVEES